MKSIKEMQPDTTLGWGWTRVHEYHAIVLNILHHFTVNVSKHNCRERSVGAAVCTNSPCSTHTDAETIDAPASRQKHENIHKLIEHVVCLSFVNLEANQINDACSRV